MQEIYHLDDIKKIITADLGGTNLVAIMAKVIKHQKKEKI